MSIKTKLLRQGLNVVLDSIFSTLSDDQLTLFLQIFREKLQETLVELYLNSPDPSGENIK